MTTIIEEEYRKKFKFDYYWKILLIIIITISIIYMFYEFKNINKDAVACTKSPFVWGQEKAREQGFYCYYSCSETQRVFNGSIFNFSFENIP